MNYETIIVDKKDHIAKLTLNRPQVSNAINLEMFHELKAALKDINDDDDVRVMVLTGAGKSFCASADLNEEAQAEVGKRFLHTMTLDEVRQFARHMPQQVTRGIRDLEKPTIAMVNGLAIGDGFDWVLACDIRIGSPFARFRNVFASVGLLPPTGGTWLYTRVLPLARALELLYTGDWLSAEEACRWGLLSKVVPLEQLEEETMALARKIAQGPPAALRLMKLHVYRGLEIDLNTALELAADAEALMLSTQDHVEGVAALLEKRQPNFTGK